MAEQLLHDAFKKAAKESGKDSLHGNAQFLSEKLLEEYKFQVSGKSLIRYYRNESTIKKDVQDHLARYLEYSDFKDYNFAQGPARTKRFPNKILAGRKRLLQFLILPVIGISGYVGYETAEEDCMVWSGDHFEQIRCTGAPHERMLNEFKLQNFRKISVTDSTSFFSNGEPNLWYYKNGDQLELFSSPGLHPENGKTLKPISSYMINKYLRQ